MHPIFLPRGHSATTVPVTFVNSATWRELRERLDARARAFADAAGFEPKAGRHLLLPGADGALDGILFALEPPVRLNAIFDWELATIGDPLADVGYLVATWAQAASRASGNAALNWRRMRP